MTASRGGLALLLLLLTVAVFAQVRSHDFVSYDDFAYVVENPILALGLGREALARIWLEPYLANWIPLTSLSLLLGHALHGPRAGGYLLGNLALHAAATLLLFFTLARMTRRNGRSAFVAAVFAVHPLHVESVAWVSERKDVLSGLFFMLTLAAYARLADAPGSVLRQAAVALCFALGLLAKPMLVTVPCLLLLLDFWPLGRLGEAAPQRLLSGRRLRACALEKLPLFCLAALSAVVTYVVQHGSGAMEFAEELPLLPRLGNALASFAVYLGKAFWPTELAPFYPFPREGPSPLLAVIGAAALTLITAAALRLARRAPYLVVGWLWFVGMLVPVIGLVQVGMQARADRYLYLPLIGLSIAVAWGVPDLLGQGRGVRRLLPAAACGAIAALAGAAWLQVAVWRDTITLFEHTLAVTRDNFVAHHALATSYTRLGRLPEARAHFEEAVLLKPSWAAAQVELAALLDRLGEPEGAIAHYQQALREKPEHAAAQGNLGLLLFHAGRPADAIPHLEKALSLREGDPGGDRTWAQIAYALGFALLQTGRVADAAPRLEQALAGGADTAAVHQALAVVSLAAGRDAEAVAHGRAALERDPRLLSAANNLAWVLATSRDPSLRDPAEAIQLAELAVRESEPENPGFLDTLAVSYAAAGRLADARRTAQRAAELAAARGDPELARQIRARAAGWGPEGARGR
ncbi:MAG TPA: tetratricopeptide repeat protein [Myxococcota bacterium]